MKATLILIENDADHAQAKASVDKLMHSDNPADDAKIAAQARLIEAYERNRWPQKTAELAEVLTYLLDQNDLARADLVPLLGTPSRVSEVLSGKRELSITMIQRLRERFHVPADVLIPSVNTTSRKKAAA
jgi:HTH-type transcriptional regulator / antitoxin HigA